MSSAAVPTKLKTNSKKRHRPSKSASKVPIASSKTDLRVEDDYDEQEEDAEEETGNAGMGAVTEEDLLNAVLDTEERRVNALTRDDVPSVRPVTAVVMDDDDDEDDDEEEDEEEDEDGFRKSDYAASSSSSSSSSSTAGAAARDKHTSTVRPMDSALARMSAASLAPDMPVLTPSAASAIVVTGPNAVSLPSLGSRLAVNSRAPVLQGSIGSAATTLATMLTTENSQARRLSDRATSANVDPVKVRQQQLSNGSSSSSSSSSSSLSRPRAPQTAREKEAEAIDRITKEMVDGRRMAFFSSYRAMCELLIKVGGGRQVNPVQYSDPHYRAGLIDRLPTRTFASEQACMFSSGIKHRSRLVGYDHVEVTGPACAMGCECIGMTVPIAGFDPLSPDPLDRGTVLTIYMTPDELERFYQDGTVPADHKTRYCVLCSRMGIHSYFATLAAHFCALPTRWLVQWYKNLEGEIFDRGRSEHEYSKNSLHHQSDQGFNGLVAPVAKLAINKLVACKVDGAPKGFYIISQEQMRHVSDPGPGPSASAAAAASDARASRSVF